MANRRLDLVLTQWGLAQSRTQAQVLIREGAVSLRLPEGWVVATKSSTLIPPEWDKSYIQIQAAESLRFVGRGGLKLEGALQKVQLNLAQASVLDVGVSTGGFADCALQHGARQVVGIDVGHGQLSPSLVGKIELYEGVNARELRQFGPLHGRHFDLIVVDVSFISLGLILPELSHFLKPTGRILALVKPQFELGAASLNKKGVVKDSRDYAKVEANVIRWCHDLHLRQLDYFASSIEGSDGNQEFFLFAALDPARSDSDQLFAVQNS